MKNFNVMVTCGRNLEDRAIRELESIFFMLGDYNAEFWKSGIGGIVLGRTTLNLDELPRMIRELIRERPWDFRFTKRYIPIEKVVPTNMDRIIKEARELGNRIPEGSTYRITIEKRRTEISSREIIVKVAEAIDRKVSLEEPDYIILIEILGGVTGISLLRADSIISVDKEIGSRYE